MDLFSCYQDSGKQFSVLSLEEKSIMLIPVKTMMDRITGGKHLSAFLNNNVKLNSSETYWKRSLDLAL